jgi:hypothetical protein
MPESRDRFWLSADEISRMRQNVRDERFALVAWLANQRIVRNAMESKPAPPSPDGEFKSGENRDCDSDDSGWFCGLYTPGLRDGRYAYSLALAYAVTGEERYADKAAEYLFGWMGVYNPAPPTSEIGHMVAEPVGFMLKAFLAYDLIREALSAREREEFRLWAAQFVERGMKQADKARDRPWVPEAPWGNSATWARSLAVTAAAVVGGETLQQTLDWNWEHTTEGGNHYGWLALLEGVMDPTGRMLEEDVRDSVDYALYTWHPLAIIATVARVTGYQHDLWTATAPEGETMLRPLEYYAPYLTMEKDSPYDYDQDRGLDVLASEYRATAETAHRRFPESDTIRQIVEHGGPEQRGLNEDQHITGFNALTGVR